MACSRAGLIIVMAAHAHNVHYHSFLQNGVE